MSDTSGVHSSLRESEARFRSVFESATDAIVLADQHGVITSWNRSAQTIFGYEEREVLGKPLTILMPPRHRARHDDGLARYHDGARAASFSSAVTSAHSLVQPNTIA